MGSDQIIVNADGPRRVARPPGRLVVIAIIAACVVAVCAMLVLLLSTTADDRRVFFVGCGVLFLAACSVGVYWLILKARRADIHYLPNQHPITFKQIAQQPYQFAADSLSQHYEVGLADASRENPLLTSLHQVYQPQHSETHTTAALPAPDEAAPDGNPLVIPPDEWLAWVNVDPHTILAAKTGGGKTVTAMAIIAPRILAGEWVFVIDPHGAAWLDLPVVGGGLKWGEIEHAVRAVGLLYQERMQQRVTYKDEHGKEPPPSFFPRLTVLLDEANETRDNISEEAWKLFVKTFSSGARKVNISLILLMQSTNVEDLGVSALVRENFTCIALEAAVIVRMLRREEGDSERRKLVLQGITKRAFPATTMRESVAYILDRAALDKRPMPSTAQASIWPGWEAYKHAQAAKQQQQQQQLPPVQTVLTLADRIVDLLERQTDLKLAEIAIELNTNKQQVQNELTKLMTAQRVDRKPAKGGSLYFLIQP